MTPRARQRIRTRTEILDTAVDVMAEQGVAALNLAEVARRVGLRQPSIYQYFDSRNAVYDALFERGVHAHRDVILAAIGSTEDGWPAVCAAMHATLRFTVEHRTVAQLIFTAPIPGFVPAETTYAISTSVYQVIQTAVTAAVGRRQLHPEASSDRGVALLVTLIAGLAAQQAANDAAATFEEGRFTALLRPTLEMYAAFFDPHQAATWAPWD